MKTKFILGWVILATSRLAFADGGAIQFQGDTGAYRLTIFTQPPTLRAGPVDITVLLQDRSQLNPLLDAKVTFDLRALDGNATNMAPWMPPACAMNKTAGLSDIAAKLGHGENRLFYGSVVQIPGSGHWQLQTRIQRGTETAEISTVLNVGPARPPILAYWRLFLLVPAGILGFVLHQTAREQRFKRSA
jgi:hypothetical protein